MSVLQRIAKLPSTSTTRATPADMGPLDPSPYRLRLGGDNGRLIERLAARLPGVSVQQVADDGNRTGTGHFAPEQPLPPRYAGLIIWDSDDEQTDWFPQGITGSADAQTDGRYEDRKLLLVSWYDNLAGDANKGVRVSFVNLANLEAPTYRHVLLVEPVEEDGQPSFREVPVHAGGLAWYGDLLYVADTSNGLRVFDIDALFRVDAADPEAINHVGYHAGKYFAYGYQYVLPQLFAYTQNTPVPFVPPRFSFVSLDRTTSPHSILVGEYSEVELDAGTRFFRWSLDEATHRLRATGGEATASWAYTMDLGHMQGVASINGKYFISHDNGDGPGELATWRPESGAIRLYGLSDPKPQDLYYDAVANWLWIHHEAKGLRGIYALYPQLFD